MYKSIGYLYPKRNYLNFIEKRKYIGTYSESVEISYSVIMLLHAW